MNYFLAFLVLYCFGCSLPSASSSPALILTSYIENNKTELARNLSLVDSKLFLNVTSHSGFLNVDPGHNSNLFFWYFPVADKKVNDTPWIIWLQGGPGVSSLTGIFDEIGPFSYEKELKLRQWSWVKRYSVLFIDNPVGAGFSFTDSEDGFVTNMGQCAVHLYRGIQQFLEIFPELRDADLYLAGESYAGHYLPTLAQQILEPPPEISKLPFNSTSIQLKGLIMGNPVIDHEDTVDLLSVYYQWGLLDHQGVLALQPLQDKYKDAVLGRKNTAFELHNELLDKLETQSSLLQTYNMAKDEINVEGFEDFVTKAEVQEAIHVGEDIKFTFTNATVHYKLVPDFSTPASSVLLKVLEHCRVLIYCGQLDLTAPCVPNAEARLEKWRWTKRQQFLDAPRHPWMFNNSLAGYVKSGGSLTEVLIRNAGHLATIDKPAETSELIDYFIRGIDLPLPINFNEKDFVNAPYTTTPLPSHQPDTSNYTVLTNQPIKIVQPATSKGVVASIVLNVVLVLAIISGALYWIRWKRRADAHFYNMVDNSSLNDAVLTMN